ncbi:hypothetical protein ZEAMMB73_Zm00001d040636 [Zea mays]|uniref:DUF4371 domain-containing protein n=1 Tax=Zea mays TaxID=4577 RepID=A0A1D6MRV5_MAIZE|nr:hypothetical protein ZEAMMB73_Zm00001d040636 [Zea mays]
MDREQLLASFDDVLVAPVLTDLAHRGGGKGGAAGATASAKPPGITPHARSSRRSPLGITQIVEVGTQLAAWPNVQSTIGPLDPLIDYHFVRTIMVFKRTTINSFYKKDIVVDVPREQGQNSSCSEEDEIANWLAAQQEDDQEEKAPEQPSPKNRLCHIEPTIEMQTSEEVKANRLRLRTSIDTIRWLAFQGCPFRGHDESANSKSQVVSSTKRNDDLRANQVAEIEHLIELNEIETGRGYIPFTL